MKQHPVDSGKYFIRFHRMERSIMKHMWRTRDGNNIPVKEMTELHLGNAIRFISRVHNKTSVHVKWLVILAVESSRREITTTVTGWLPDLLSITSKKLIASDTRATETFDIFINHNITCKCGASDLYPVYFDYVRSDDGCTYNMDIICYSCSMINYFVREYYGYGNYDTWNNTIIS